MSNTIENKLYTVSEVSKFIKDGKLLALAGSESLLSQLPAGNWVGGTIPYFMTADVCQFNDAMIFVNDLTEIAVDYSIKEYDENNIGKLVKDTFDNGFTFLVIPAFQPVHQKYALTAPQIEGVYENPVTGWITGMDLNSQNSPKTFDGKQAKALASKAVALHVKIADEKVARLDIVNIFKEDSGSVEIRFLDDGFSASDCIINGEEKNLVDYITENAIDTKLPLIANYTGARINISIKGIDEEKKVVDFYAPVFKDMAYKFAQPLESYIASFEKEVPDIQSPLVFSCNCILNYLYGELEGKKVKDISGPITFGEIGYILLNQTLTYLVVE